MQKLLVLIGIAMLLAGGCVSNTNPILKPAQLITDNALIGKWIAVQDSNPPVIDILPPGDDKVSKVQFTNGEDKKQRLATARLGKIGSLEVVEFKVKPQDHDSSETKDAYVCAILRQANADAITSDTLDVDWLKSYLGDHPHELMSKYDAKADQIVILSSTDVFQRFLLRHCRDDVAFKTIHWVRLDNNTTQPTTAPATGPG